MNSVLFDPTMRDYLRVSYRARTPLVGAGETAGEQVGAA
jgi:hypothetical protein